MGDIKLNYEMVMKKVEAAALKSGRTVDVITIIGVTKTQTISDMEELYSCGITEFGENRVQELLSKYDAMSAKPVWHLIGHLQRNKVKQVVGKVALIHSVDSVELAEEIGKRSREAGIVSDVLVEVNIGSEDSKFGITLESAHSFVDNIKTLSGVSVKGLMCIAPFVENPDNNRELFRKMYNVFVDIRDKNADNVHMSYLSMGMTNDYEAAIEEGSNMIRIGTGFFGVRNLV